MHTHRNLSLHHEKSEASGILRSALYIAEDENPLSIIKQKQVYGKELLKIYEKSLFPWPAALNVIGFSHPAAPGAVTKKVSPERDLNIQH